MGELLGDLSAQEEQMWAELPTTPGAIQEVMHENRQTAEMNLFPEEYE